MTDFDTWMLDVGYDRIFRMLVKRRVGDWTPYEWDRKFSDESQYEDNHYIFAKIVEVIELPDRDILIGYKAIFDGEDLEDKRYHQLHIDYKRLSEIELTFFPDDMDYFYSENGEE